MKSFNLCQCDSFKSAEYNTFAFDSKKKFGFVCVNIECGFVSHVAFDSVQDLAELFGSEIDFYSALGLEKLNVGESYKNMSDVWTRVW